MEKSMFLAQLIGPIYVIVGVGLLFNYKSYAKTFDDFIMNSALMYIGGLIALLIGMLLILFHNIWIKNWTVILTILGWVAFLKGVILIVFPEEFPRIFHFKRHNGWIIFGGLFALVLGGYLSYMGYMVV